MRDLGFAFNDKDFSDRTLHLELVGDFSDSESDSDGSESSETQNLHKKQKIEVSTEKGDGKNSNGSSTTVKVKILHIISAILAASSPFFFKLFKNGMRESQERNVTLRINASEKRAFMDMLNFVYTNTLKATSAADLLSVLMAADKYEVSSCMSHCSKVLKKMPMSLESALLYVEIPSSVLVSEVVQSLIDEGKNYLLTRFGDITERDLTCQEEAMVLPLSAIEVVLGGINEVNSEDDVYDFILRWGRARYPKRRERQQVLTKLVGRYLYFPYLGMSRLREIQDSPEFDTKQVSKLMMESLYLSAGYPYGEQFRFPAVVGHLAHLCLKREYYYFPVKEVQTESGHVVYLNLTKDLCESLVGVLYEDRCSQVFFVGDKPFKFWVSAECKIGKENYLGLFVEMQKGKHETCTFDYELEVQMDEEEEFESKQKIENCTFSVEERVGSANLFGVPWRDFMGRRSCEYFFDGILHLRARFTFNKYSNSHTLC